MLCFTGTQAKPETARNVMDGEYEPYARSPDVACKYGQHLLILRGPDTKPGTAGKVFVQVRAYSCPTAQVSVHPVIPFFDDFSGIRVFPTFLSLHIITCVTCVCVGR
jgi:hypothetical protein